MDILQGERVSLRLITHEDTDNILKWRNSSRVRNNFLDQRLFTKEGHRYWLENYVFTGKVVQFIIIDNEANKDIGSIYLRDINREHEKAEYGIFIGDEEGLGKGYATEAGRIVVEFAKRELKLHRLYLKVLYENKGAIKSYEKVGFQEEGILKDEVFLGGKYHNIVLMGMIIL